MGKTFNWIKKLPFAWLGVGGVLISAAFNGINQFYPLTNYEFVSQELARKLFWFFIALGILGAIFILVAIIKKARKGDRDMSEEKERISIEKLKIKQDVSDADKATGLEVENQDAELRDVEIDMKARNVREVTGASFKQTNKPALSSYMILCECGERIGRVFTGTPPSTIKCPKCGKEHDVHPR